MKVEEVNKILNCIKSNYQTFRIDEDVILEWTRRLTKYEYEEILESLDKYLEYGKEPPLINDLTYGLKTIEQKESSNKLNGYIICSKCGKKHESIEKADDCYERDITLMQINKYCNIFNLNFNDYFKNDTLEELNKNYDRFLLQVIEEQKKSPLLQGKDLQGLRIYYKNVLRCKQ